jgi:hypothetical protein
LPAARRAAGGATIHRGHRHFVLLLLQSALTLAAAAARAAPVRRGRGAGWRGNLVGFHRRESELI